MTRKKYVSPVLTVEFIEADDLMLNASYTNTTSFLEDPSEDDNELIPIHPNPIDPPGPIDDGDDY